MLLAYSSILLGGVAGGRHDAQPLLGVVAPQAGRAVGYTCTGIYIYIYIYIQCMGGGSPGQSQAHVRAGRGPRVLF